MTNPPKMFRETADYAGLDEALAELAKHGVSCYLDMDDARTVMWLDEGAPITFPAR